MRSGRNPNSNIDRNPSSDGNVYIDSSGNVDSNIDADGNGIGNTWLRHDGELYRTGCGDT